MKSLFYLITLSFIVLMVVFSRFTQVPVSINLAGMIRPGQERTNVISLTGGIIDSIFVTEGESVLYTDLLFRLKNHDRENQLALLDYEIKWRTDYIHDLQTLKNIKSHFSVFPSLIHPVLRQQYNRFKFSDMELTFSLQKAKKELDMAIHLASEKVIAPKELFDKETEFNRLTAAREAFLAEQPLLWEQELDLKRQELKKFETERVYLLENEYRFLIKAPVSGIVQEINTLYPGSVIQAGQFLGTISPDASLIAECIASPRNVGLLMPGQEVRYQIDAFDYRYFGILTGKIIAIDHDFSIFDHKPVYKVRCSVSEPRLLLKNGYSGRLKKGMTLNARFIIAERTLWQLLWDTMDDWLNPLNQQSAE